MAEKASIQIFNPITRDFLALLLVGVAFMGVSCRKPEAPKQIEIGTFVAVVAGEQITVDRLRDELARRYRHETGDLTTAQKLAALETLIQTDALYAKAKAEGFERTPEMEARIKNFVAAQFKEARFPASKTAVTDQEIEQYYTANKGQFATPLAVHAAVILLEAPANPTPGKQNEFRAKAASVLAEAKTAGTPQAFAEVVRRHSDDQASRYRGGDIGWLNADASGAHSNLIQALAELQKPGDFAPLIATGRGLFIAKLLEKKSAGYKSLHEVKDTIRYQLARLKARQAEADFQASIKEGLDIHVNQQLLESITLPAERNEPPKMPETRTAQLRQ